MLRSRRGKKYTFIRGVTNVIAMTMTPLIILLIFGNLYSIGYSNTLLADSNEKIANQWTRQIDGNLEMIERSLSSIAFVEPEFATMGNAESVLSVHLASYVIAQRLDTTMNAFPALGGLFMYSEQDGAWVERFADADYTYAFREAVRNMIRSQEDWKERPGKWRVEEISDSYMLFFCLRHNDAYMVAMADFNRLLTITEQDYRLTYIDGAGRALAGGNVLPADMDEAASGRSYAVVDDMRYLTVWSSLERAPVRLVLAVSKAGYWDGLTPVQVVMLILSLLTILMIPVARLWVRHNLGEPLADLSSAMERIKRGQLDVPIAEEYDTQELDQVKSTLNDMMAQIRTLKIAAYEHELDRQRIEMQCLHMQLRPHFFLNCLKNIYACAQRQRFQQVQEMTLAISDYIRYLFRDNLKMVTLREELQYVRNYIQIQRLSLSMPPRCEFSVDESLMDLQVPPLFIESFVENAVKHQWKPDRQLIISVRAVVLEADDGRYLDITVRDNGDGFSAQVLEQINSLPDDSFYREFHVGLTNLNHRLRLIYGGRAALAFYNDGNGAVCEAICPLPIESVNKEMEERQ